VADFEVVSVAPNALVVVPWADPDFGGLPSRTTAGADVPHRYLKAAPGVQLTFEARIAGVLVADAGLGALLFGWAWTEFAVTAPPMSTVAGTSARLFVDLQPQHLGHHVLNVWRQGHGKLVIPFDVEP
jgi:hypothetical protein